MITSEQSVENATLGKSPSDPETPKGFFKNDPGVRASSPLTEPAFAAIRTRSVLEGCKWDPQVGDVQTLARFPLIMKKLVWSELARGAEQLAAEAMAAEVEISARPDLIRQLGLPCSLVSVLSDASIPSMPTLGRVIRFDFHPTIDGWRISEANSDVPGGFTEASHFTALVAEHFPNLRVAGDPAGALCHALTRSRRGNEAENFKIALLSAPGYMEDHQVIAFLASQLRDRRCDAFLTGPEQIVWRDGIAHLETPCYRGPVDALIRFYQAEWLSRLPASTGWHKFFCNGRTPVTNPALAVISESKRFPVVWRNLSTPLPAWQRLLPETRDPRKVPWSRNGDWLLKTAMCNTGDSITVREWMRPSDWLRTRLAVSLAPGAWIAQRRFQSIPILTPEGPRHVCIGVYVVDGRAAGAYARMSERAMIDFSAVDVALLIEDDD